MTLREVGFMVVGSYVGFLAALAMFEAFSHCRSHRWRKSPVTDRDKDMVEGSGNAARVDLFGRGVNRRLYETPDEDRQSSGPSPVDHSGEEGSRAGYARVAAGIARKVWALLWTDLEAAGRTMTAALKSHDDQGISIPNWFLRVVGMGVTVLTVAFVPWSIWITTKAFASADIAESVKQNTAKIREIEQASAATATQLQVISATRFSAEHGEILRKGIESRIDKIETRVIDLQRELDRRLGGR